MVKIRLQRFGSPKKPYYRLVAVDSRAKRDGAYIELLGAYEPTKDYVKLENEKIVKWLLDGAQPTDTVRSILRKEGVLKQFNDAKLSK